MKNNLLLKRLLVIIPSLWLLVLTLVYFDVYEQRPIIGLLKTLQSDSALKVVDYSVEKPANSKAIPAAELTLLSLTEVIGGIFWVWLPLFGINEVPTNNTIIGGFFLFISLTYYSLVMRWNKRYIGLN